VFLDLRDPDRLEGKCGICEFKQVCLGCRARAFGMMGDYLAEEPFCVYQPRGTEGLERHV
jgi:radical SAM protein with 4Fe4S-binding SPASM domain